MNFYRNFSFLVAIFLMAIMSGCDSSVTGGKPGGSCEDCTEQTDEGPGEIYLQDEAVCSESDKRTGSITVIVTNGYEAIWLEDENGNQIEGQYSDDFTPQDGQDYTFSPLPAGTYIVAAERNDKASRSDKIVVETCPVNQQKPNAEFVWEEGAEELSIDFDASESSDPDGTIESYEWLGFGDGGDGEGVTITHHYDWPGTYPVTLAVTDNDGLKDEVTHEVKVEADDFGDIKELERSCYQFDGIISFSIENGLTGYRLTEVDRNVVIAEADGLDPDNHKKLEFDNLADAEHRLEFFRYNHEDQRTFSFNCDFDPDDYSWSHEFNGGFDESVWINSSQDHYIRDLASWGEYRPFLTEDGPVGEVVIEVQAQTDYPDKGHYAVVLCLDKGCSDTITTPLIDFKVYENNWVRGATKIDAGRLTDYARKYIRVRVVHGDEINDDKPDGQDKVTFSIEGDVPTWSTTHWNTSSRAKGFGGDFVTNSQGEFEVRNKTLFPYRN